MADQNRGRVEVVSRALHRAMADNDGVLAHLPVAVYSCDVDGIIVQYNHAAAALWGRAPTLGDPCVRYCGAERVFKEDGAPLTPDEAPAALVLRTSTPVRDLELIIQRPDDSRIVVLASADPLFDEDGALIGAATCLQDVTVLRGQERRARRGQRAFRELIDALPAAIYTTDAAGRITFFNKSAVKLWGRAPKLNQDLWCGSYKLLTADGAPMRHEDCPMGRALKEGAPIRNVEAIVERPDGSRVPCMPYPTPFHDASGVLLGAINMMVDISDVKRAEARQKIMIDELNHRVKNTLATVQAMALQTFGARASGAGGDVDAFLARLLALSKTHDHLTREQWESADLLALIEDVLEPLRMRCGERVAIESVRIRLSPRAAVTLGLALNELATNSTKYGSMSVAAGHLRVYGVVEDSGDVYVAWRESGGPCVRTPTERGFGTRMIERAVASDLDGRAEIRFAEAGLECDLHVPLAALA